MNCDGDMYKHINGHVGLEQLFNEIPDEKSATYP